MFFFPKYLFFIFILNNNVNKIYFNFKISIIITSEQGRTSFVQRKFLRFMWFALHLKRSHNSTTKNCIFNMEVSKTNKNRRSLGFYGTAGTFLKTYWSMTILTIKNTLSAVYLRNFYTFEINLNVWKMLTEHSRYFWNTSRKYWDILECENVCGTQYTLQDG